MTRRIYAIYQEKDTTDVNNQFPAIKKGNFNKITTMKRIVSLFVICLFFLSACGQNNAPVNQKTNDIKVGNDCEDCEAIYECPVPFDQLPAVDTLPSYNEEGLKIKISGTVYKKDGVMVAPNVVLYVYHTDQKGVYPKQENEKGIATRHGFIRSWIKTDTAGRYAFYTLVPASYPNSNNPKHIHAIVKEPGKTEYWIDDFLFADDPLLPKEKREHPRGGNGVLHTTRDGALLQATRNIILGRNVTPYPD